jgi:hypothetical protein
LLEGLNQSVQKDAVKTTVAEFYAILVMFAEGVHRLLLCGEIPGTYGGESLCDIEHHNGISRAKPHKR